MQLIISRKSHKTLEEVNESWKKLKEVQSNLNSEVKFNECAKSKNNLELIYGKIAEGVTIRSKCQCYEEGESQLNVFLISKKKLIGKNVGKKRNVSGKEICVQAKVNDEIKIFF